jgi:hypothetical protein
MRARDFFGAGQSWEGSRYRIPEEPSPAAAAAAVATRKLAPAAPECRIVVARAQVSRERSCMTIAIVRAGLVRAALIAEGEIALVEWGPVLSRHGAEGFESSLDAAELVRCS